MMVANRYSTLETLKQNSSEQAFLVADQSQDNKTCLLQEWICPSAAIAQQIDPQIRSARQMLGVLNHPQLQIPRDFFRQGQSLYFVQSHIPGQTYQALQSIRPALNEVEIEQWFKQVLPVLAYLHQHQICHRNLSPESIVLNNQNGLPILTDFGAIRDLKAQVSTVPLDATLSDHIKQLPIGISPTGSNEDLYMLGVTALILLTGQDISTLFDFQSRTWDWERHKLLSDRMSGFLSRLLMIQGQGFLSAETALQSLNSPSSAATFAPPQTFGVPTAAYAPPIAPTYAPPSQAWQPPVQPSASTRRIDPKIYIGAGIGAGLLLLAIVIPSFTNQIGKHRASESIAESSEASPSTASTPKTPSLTEADAVEVIRSWIQAKRQVFAPPFNREIAASLTTGSLYYDIVKPGGSIDWMKNNNAFYQFGVQKVEPVGQFFVSGNQGTITVKITEDRTMYVNNKIDRTQTKLDISTVRYELQFVDGRWKLADYK